ncbi:hypothetical protein CDO73_11690 [Saccharibacillus sp. O23]|uniref:MDR family MFS transporter n=1 Tax=Saccharibacillus sp. O23 TaxID=2009338 RepID=UPI000B4E1C07|nr:MDR family MFS transporter [Saccharibacillus sp. O23]OWR30562.1 hypothetical protein CDO73_11690 [Saccharibacillus sp. O23]
MSDHTENKQTYQMIPIMAALLLSGFVGMFNETALNIALADLIDLFQISNAAGQWLTTGYLLTLGILLPITGLLLQRFTMRQLFTVSLAFSITGTLIAIFSPGFGMLLVARVVQAAGVAVMLPLMYSTVLMIIPPAKRGGAYGLIGLVLVVAPAVGPTISGLLLERLGWHWIFIITLPVLLVSLLIGLRYLQNFSTVTKPKLDLLSLCFSTLGFGGIVFAFSSAGEHEGGLIAPTVLVPLIVGVFALFVFIRRQLRLQQPLMDLRAFTYKMFAIGAIMIFLNLIIMLSATIMLPMFLIRSLGLNAFEAGLVMLPGGIVNAVMLPIMGKVFDKYGPKWVVPIGMSMIVAVLWLLSGLTVDSTLLQVVILHTFLMIGIAMVWMPSQANGLNQLPPQLYSHGSAIMNTIQQLAGAIGTAVAVSIMTLGMSDYINRFAGQSNIEASAAATGISAVFTVAIFIAAAGLICSFFIKRVHVSNV